MFPAYPEERWLSYGTHARGTFQGHERQAHESERLRRHDHFPGCGSYAHLHGHGWQRTFCPGDQERQG